MKVEKTCYTFYIESIRSDNMVCKKCKRECLESELKDGVCIECTSKKKNNTIRIIIISVVISAILNLGITIWFNNDAKVSDFKIE